MDNGITKELTEWYQKISQIRLPRFEELPEIELYMDQVIALMDKYLAVFSDDIPKLITPSIINNYVKQGVIPPPVKKRYTREHIARLIMICIFKQILSISNIQVLIQSSLEFNTIDEIYNFFADQYETFTCQAIEDSREQFEGMHRKEKNGRKAVSKLSFYLAMSASASKNMAEKLISLGRSSDAPEEDEKKEKRKKDES